MDNDLISREALRNEIDTWGCNDYDKYDFLEAIDKAPTVEPDCLHCKQYQGGYDYGFNIGYNKGKKERPQCECEKCVFRKFSAKFIDDMVKVMAKNGITSVEQLMETLKGGDK